MTPAVSEESPVVSQASTWSDLGCALQDAKRYQEALSAFTQAQAIDPDYPGLRFRIAYTHFELGNFSRALDLYEALVRENPGEGSVWSNLSVTAQRCRQWNTSLASAQRAFELIPNDPVQLANYALVLSEFRRFKRANYLLNRAVSLDPGNETTRLNLGLAQLAEGDFKNGWRNYASRRGFKLKNLPSLLNPSIPEWRGGSLAQKNLLIWHEPWEGHGDAILFLRYAAALAERVRQSPDDDGLIMFACHEQLRAFFARSLAEYCNELFVVTGSKGMQWQPQHFYGRKPLQCSMSSLPLWSGETIPSKFPYLTPDPLKMDLWRKRLSADRNLKIGFSWTGRADHPRNDLRSIPILDLMERLKDIQSVSFYSLQLSTPDQIEVALQIPKPDQSETAKTSNMIDFTRELASFDETAALVSHLDLVIAMDGVIAHLAGALNVPTWVLVDVNPYWGWQRHGRDTLWYRSVRIYRQQKMHRWEEVFEEIRGDLNADLFR